ncbi:MAG TPA: histidine phosphatase family protein [Terriglobales bacterium]|nr:histidine phosphatase family protein [Terriglobales bacterium]
MSAASTRVYLFRHGEVVLAETRRFIGHLDVALSARGEAQCVAQAGRLRDVPLAALYSSDLARARRSGELLGAPRALRPVVVPALREMAMGRWEGLTAAEIQAREPQAFDTWMASVGAFPFPEGESVPDLVARAWPAFVTLVEAHRGATIAVVAHGGTNRAMLCRALGVPLDRLLAFGQGYAAMNVLEHTDGRWALRRLNEEPGLGGA